MAVMTTPAPWDDCKVAFGIHHIEKFELWLDRTNCGARLLPAGWEFCETDSAGSRYVVVFRVSDMPTAADGRAVAELLSEFISDTPSNVGAGAKP